MAPNASHDRPWREANRRFRAWLRGLSPATPIVLLAGGQIDGYAAGVVLARTLERTGHHTRLLVVPRGEVAWEPALLERLASGEPVAVVGVGIGQPATPIPTSLPVLVVDHYPLAEAAGAVVISAAGWQPPQSASSLVYWLGQAGGRVETLGWVAAVGHLAALGERAPSPLVESVRRAYGAQWAREVMVLLRMAGRAAPPPTRAAVSLLRQAHGPRDAITGGRPELATLVAAREMVDSAIERARAVPPRIISPFTLVRLDSPCQIEGVLARIHQAQRPEQPVLVGNTGDFAGQIGFAGLGAHDPAWLNRLVAALPTGTWLDRESGDTDTIAGAVTAREWPAVLSRLGLPATAWSTGRRPSGQH